MPYETSRVMLPRSKRLILHAWVQESPRSIGENAQIQAKTETPDPFILMQRAMKRSLIGVASRLSFETFGGMRF